MTFGGVIGELVEVGHANEGVARLVVRGNVATYRHHHGKPDQIIPELLLELSLILSHDEFSVTILADERFLALRAETHGAETISAMNGGAENGVFTYARAGLPCGLCKAKTCCM